MKKSAAEETKDTSAEDDAGVKAVEEYLAKVRSRHVRRSRRCVP
jgi:hypothetical protein